MRFKLFDFIICITYYCSYCNKWAPYVYKHLIQVDLLDIFLKWLLPRYLIQLDPYLFSSKSPLNVVFTDMYILCMSILSSKPA